MGDIKNQRSSPINIEQFMINVRLLMGGIGLDPSMVGWADMLTGGIGEGGAFHTSAQIMRRSQDIRTAASEGINQILHLDWGLLTTNNLSLKITLGKLNIIQTKLQQLQKKSTMLNQE